jgi:acetyltransferase-like isoleucine patch superfamily enzyme
MKKLLLLTAMLLPWRVRRALLCKAFGFDIHPTARIGLSFVFPQRLKMDAHSRIGHLTVAKNLGFIHLGEHSSIGNLNWITGFPPGPSAHFAHQPERRPELLVGAHSAITHRHLIDCTATVTIGPFSTFAGFQSQILTHSIDLTASRQSSAPVTIGAYCFVGTNCVLLGGAALPDRSVLGAKSLLNKAFTEPCQLYGGVPAKPLQTIPEGSTAYFHRAEGSVV